MPTTDTRRIVLIEDNRVLAKVIYEELVEDPDFTVSLATDGESGLQMAREMKPDLALLDILLPKMNGFEVLRKLKQDDSTRAIPVVMLTMLGSQGDIDRATALGAEGYIIKSQHSVAEIVRKVHEFFSTAAKV